MPGNLVTIFLNLVTNPYRIHAGHCYESVFEMFIYNTKMEKSKIICLTQHKLQTSSLDPRIMWLLKPRIFVICFMHLQLAKDCGYIWNY